MFTETTEGHAVLDKVEDLSTRYVEKTGNAPVLIDGAVIAAGKWQQMVDLTQQDFKERGVVVSRNNRKLYTSRIFEGTGEQSEYDDKTLKVKRGSGSFTPPILAHGIRSLHPGMKDLVLVHSHPMPTELDHLKTTPLSDTDIHAFINSNYKGLVMVDRGGAHLLVRTHDSYTDGELLKQKIVHEAIRSVNSENGSVMDVLKILSGKLTPYGLCYLYTPELTPDSSGCVRFHTPESFNQ